VELNILISLAGIIGAGFSSYYGVRIAQAEIRRDIAHHQDRIDDHHQRINRLEQPYFRRAGDPHP